MEKQNSQFTLTYEWHSLLRDLRCNLWAVVLAALIAYMGIYVAERSIYTPTYTSNAILVVNAKVGTSGAYTNLSVSSEMATIFTKVFTQSSMKKMAAENIGLEQFKGTISASVLGSTNMMNLSVSASDPELAYHLLTSVLEVYPNISESVFSNAVIDIMTAPQLPTGPSNFISTPLRGFYMLLAAAAQTGLILFLSLLRDTVKNEKSFTDKIDSKLLGTIVHEKVHLTIKERFLRKKRALLINDAFSSLKFSEDYQKIATKLEYMNKKSGSKVWTITSVAENEGKSTAAANIAIALAGRGNRVLLIDLDARKPSIYKIFDCSKYLRLDFFDNFILERQSTSLELLRYRKSELFLALSKKNHSKGAEWLNTPLFKAWITKRRDDMDFIIIDTAPLSVSADAVNLMDLSDKSILVVRTDVVAAPDINDATITLSSAGGRFAGCILNDVYKPFTLFGQIGTDEGGYYNNKYSSYKRYGGYENQLLSYPLNEDNATEEATTNGWE